MPAPHCHTCNERHYANEPHMRRVYHGGGKVTVEPVTPDVTPAPSVTRSVTPRVTRVTKPVTPPAQTQQREAGQRSGSCCSACGRPFRRYLTNADRQRAYRQRKAGR